MREAEVLIAGGGAAGAAAACGLAAAGRRTLVLERAAGPHDKVCGEFVSVEAAEALDRLGLHPATLDARPIGTFRLFAEAEAAECALPFPAFGLSRRRLDAALLDRAQALGAEVRRGVGVRRIEDGTAVLEDGGRERAEVVALATGKHEMRDRARRPPDRRAERKIGLKTHLRLGAGARRRLGDAVEVHLYAGGYAGLQPIEGGLANLCLVVDAARFAASGGRLEPLLRAVAPPGSALRDRLARSEPAFDRPLAVSRIPYGFRCWRESEDPPWLWRIGDQAAVTPSFTGDGLAIALRSSALAADALAGGAAAEAYRTRLSREIGPQLGRAGALDRLLVSATVRRAAVRAGRLFPSLLRLCASATRLKPSA